MRRLKYCLAIMIFPFILAQALAAGSAQTDLLQLYRQMKDANPSVAMAEAKARLGANRERAAFGQLLPQVALQSTLSQTWYSRQALDTHYSGERYSLSVSQVLFDRSLWQKYRRAGAVAQQYGAASSDQLAEASVELLRLYFSILAAEDQLALSRAEQDVVLRGLARVDSLYRQQLAPITDKLDLQARADELSARVLEADNLVALTRTSLAEVIGRQVDEPLARLPADSSTLLNVESQGLDDWQHAALAGSTRLRIQRASLAAAEAELAASRGARYPRVSLSVAYQGSDIGYENAPADRSDSQVVALQVHVPLYSGGALSAEIAAAEELVLMEAQTLEALRREVLKEVEVAYLNVQSYRARIQAGLTAVDSAREARRAAEKSFAYGIKNGIDVLEAVRSEFDARSRYLDAQYNFLIHYALLMKLAGRLDETIITRLNEVFLIGRTAGQSDA